MQMDWNKHLGKLLNVTMNENYGVVYGKGEKDHPVFYEIVFKTGNLISAFDEGLLLEATRENQVYNIYIPFTSIKCVEIF